MSFGVKIFAYSGDQMFFVDHKPEVNKKDDLLCKKTIHLGLDLTNISGKFRKQSNKAFDFWKFHYKLHFSAF